MGPLRPDARTRVSLLGGRNRRRRVLGADPPRARLPGQLDAPGLFLRPRNPPRGTRSGRTGGPPHDDGVRRRRARPPPPAGGRGLLPEIHRHLRGVGAGSRRAGARPRPRTRRAGLRRGGLPGTPHPDALPHPRRAGGGRRRTRGMGRRADLERGPRVLDGGHRPGGHRGVPPAAVPEPGGPRRLRLREPDPEGTAPAAHRRHHLRDAGRGRRRPAAHRAGVPELLPAPHRGRQRDHPAHDLARPARRSSTTRPRSRNSAPPAATANSSNRPARRSSAGPR